MSDISGSIVARTPTRPGMRDDPDAWPCHQGRIRVIPDGHRVSRSAPWIHDRDNGWTHHREATAGAVQPTAPPPLPFAAQPTHRRGGERCGVVHRARHISRAGVVRHRGCGHGRRRSLRLSPGLGAPAGAGRSRDAIGSPHPQPRRRRARSRGDPAACPVRRCELDLRRRLGLGLAPVADASRADRGGRRPAAPPRPRPGSTRPAGARPTDRSSERLAGRDGRAGQLLGPDHRHRTDGDRL